jgi:uncharacterized protein DUF3108
MNSLSFIFAVFYFGLFISPVSVTDIGDMDTHIVKNDQLPFQGGERITMKVFYNWKSVWVGAGELVLKTNEDIKFGKPVFRIVAIGQTYKRYEMFYKVRDRYESFIDKVTLKPIEFVRDVNEGGFIIDENYRFNHGTGKVITSNFKHDPVKIDTYRITQDVFDVVSVIYHARNIDYNNYTIGDKIPFNVFIDGKTYNLEMDFLGRKTIRTKMGKFKTFMLKPSLIDNEYFEKEDKMIIYVSDDENKLPIRVESPLTVGRVLADLKSYSGLKYPFNAKIRK